RGAACLYSRSPEPGAEIAGTRRRPARILRHRLSTPYDLGRDRGYDRESLGEAGFPMIRRIAFELLLFLLPFALYAAYLRLSKREEERPKEAHPWTVLFASGLALVAASFLIWGIT